MQNILKNTFLKVAVVAQALLPLSAQVAEVGTLPGDFMVDNTGRANFSIPLALPSGTAGMEPSLSFDYSSQTSNGYLGVGWKLGGIQSITRSSSTWIHDDEQIDSVDFDELDRFMLNGERLNLVNASSSYGADQSEYRTEVESFTKVIAFGSAGNGPVSFKAWTKSGLILTFGGTEDSKIEASNRSDGSILEWALSRIEDTSGNYIDFSFNETDAEEGTSEYYLVRISYTGNENAGLAPYHSVEFQYESRPDTRSSYGGGSGVSLTKRLKRAVISAESNPLSFYELNYVQSPATGQSVIDSIQLFSGSPSSRKNSYLNPTLFEWQSSPNISPGWVQTSTLDFQNDLRSSDFKDQGMRIADFDSDGLPDFLAGLSGSREAIKNTGADFSSLTGSDYTPTFDFTDSSERDLGYRTVDVDGDQMVDVLFSRNGSKAAFRNNGTGFETAPSTWLLADEIVDSNYIPYGRFVELNGDGLPDFVNLQQRRAYINLHGENQGSANVWDLATNYAIPSDIPNSSSQLGAIRLIDLNGDGLSDILYSYQSGTTLTSISYLNSGGGWVSAPSYNLAQALSDSSNGEQGIRFCDLNGDSLPDYIFHHETSGSQTQKGAYLNSGTGWISAATFIPPLLVSSNSTDNRNDHGSYFGDLNGDGLDDFILSNEGIDGGSAQSATYLNTGKGWSTESANDYELPHPLVNSEQKSYGATFLDADGDGDIDFLYAHDGTRELFLNTVKRDVMVSAQNGFGEETSVDYTTIAGSNNLVYTKGNGAQFPIVDLQTPLFVASSITKEDGVGGLYRSVFSYIGARSHSQGRGFLGFQTFESLDERRGISTIETLSQVFPHIGMVSQSEEYIDLSPSQDGSDLQLLSQSSNTLRKVQIVHDDTVNPSLSTYWPVVSSSTEHSIVFVDPNIEAEAQPSASQVLEKPDSTTTTYFQGLTSNYPTDPTSELAASGSSFFGNISRIDIDYGDGIHSDTTLNLYSPANTSSWILGRLIQSRRLAFKGSEVRQRVSAFGYDPVTGLQTSETIEPSTILDDGFVASITSDFTAKTLQTRYQRDGFGNIERTYLSGTALPEYLASRNYFDPKGRFATKTENALGHPAYTSFHPSFGEITRAEDANGLQTIFHYTPFGLLLRSDRPDKTSTSISREWCSESEPGTYKIRTETTGQPFQIEYYDHLQRKVLTAVEGPDGRIIQNYNRYNAKGEVKAVSEPHFEGSFNTYETQSFQDALGRTYKTQAPDGTLVYQLDAGLRQIELRKYNHLNEITRTLSKTTVLNAKGQASEVIDTEGNAITFGYTAIGDLASKQARDSSGELQPLQNNLYDDRGFLRETRDADMGFRQYQYSAEGDLKQETDAKNQVTRYDYDILRRPTDTFFDGSTSDPNDDESHHWRYDSTANYNNAGRGLIGAKSFEFVQDSNGQTTFIQAYAFDQFARPIFEIHQVDGKEFLTQRTFDAQSRLETQQFSWRIRAFEQSKSDRRWEKYGFKNIRTDSGYITEVTNLGGVSWWKADPSDINPQGQFKEFKLGNGVETFQTFDDQNHFLQSIQSVFFDDINGGVKRVQDWSFSFDGHGNLKFRTDSRNTNNPLRESFDYDLLERLTHIGSPLTGGQLEEVASYDPYGRIKTKNDVTRNPGSEYIYDEEHFHAVESAGDLRLDYDANGCMTQRTDTRTGRTNFTWNGYSKPRSILKGNTGSLFTYGPSRQRVTHTLRKGGVDSTKKVYIGGLFEQEQESVNGAWQTKTTRVYIPTPTGVVGVYHRKADDSTPTYPNAQPYAPDGYRYYFHRDHLGSVDAITREDISIAEDFVEVLSYNAWGQRRDAQTWQILTPDHQPGRPTDQGFTGHEMLDDLALVHMNGRIYDPYLGRMLSADPNIPDPTNLQSHDRYSYVLNNPVSYTDPSGYFFRKIFKAASSFFQKFRSTIISVALNAIPGIGQYLAIAYNTYEGFRKGGIRGGLIGFASSLIGSASKLSSNLWNSLNISPGLGGALANGVFTIASGGNALTSILQGATSSLLGNASQSIKFLSNNWIGRIIKSAIIGGTSSVIGGQKFANGAQSSAFLQIFQHSRTSSNTESEGYTINNSDNRRDSIPSGVTKIFRRLLGFDSSIDIGDVQFDIIGGTEKQRSDTITSIGHIFSTPRGQQMLSTLQRRNGFLGLFPQSFNVDLRVSNNAFTFTHHDTIYVDPALSTNILTTQGWMPASTTRIIAHELGHAIMGDRDNGPLNLHNTIRNENPIMNSLGQPSRIRY
ncbi:FG-GAP-like repeat-containing protein [Roseibacillus persicicus]|uniref:Insecticide toxin TcdB middle/N-terminal domain-containing protein n=1 Tax=Roseibacillus persicicus TaxID=454148 RepID=A0A918WQ04_9BACT|nr:FG-GAP-like repeat-containing protein [Roseibacillus persicicus]GHC65207.1 hypothetical protein GCM10007100_36170 [Roseibacillus persicicus]